MINIAVITSTRAEFGLLMPVINELRKNENDNFRVELIVTGTHLSKDYGYTISEIEGNEIRIDEIIEIPVHSETALDISNNQAECLKSFTALFMKKNYNAILILGDRYEILSVAISAGNTHTPIFHMCGGDTTQGAIDEWIRHSITKMSYLHFVTNEESRKRVIQLGEEPERVFNYGSTSIDNIIKIADMRKAQALESIGLTDCDYAICTYHPVTMEDTSVEWQINEFIQAIQDCPDISFIVTKSNADKGGSEINRLLDEAGESVPNLYVMSSLGVRRYLSLMKYSRFVLGNSSSGIIETPAFKIPTINIGDRQKGRLQSESIINCEPDRNSISNAMKKALTPQFRSLCQTIESPYGDGNAAKRIADKIVEVLTSSQINLKKSFYDF